MKLTQSRIDAIDQPDRNGPFWDFTFQWLHPYFVVPEWSFYRGAGRGKTIYHAIRIAQDELKSRYPGVDLCFRDVRTYQAIRF